MKSLIKKCTRKVRDYFTRPLYHQLERAFYTQAMLNAQVLSRHFLDTYKEQFNGGGGEYRICEITRFYK